MGFVTRVSCPENSCGSGRRGGLERSGKIKKPLPAETGEGTGVRWNAGLNYLAGFLGCGPKLLSAPAGGAPGNPPAAGAASLFRLITPPPPPPPFRSSIIMLQG